MKRGITLPVSRSEENKYEYFYPFEGFDEREESDKEPWTEAKDSEAICKKLRNNISEAKRDILSAIQGGDTARLTGLLKTRYIYPEKVRLYPVEILSRHHNGNYADEAIYEYQGYFHQRPMIEGLFFEERDFFIQIFQALKTLQGNSLVNCFNILQGAMLDTELNPEKLFTWSPRQQRETSIAIQKMKNHVVDYGQDKTDSEFNALKKQKREATEQLVTQLSDKYKQLDTLSKATTGQQIAKIDFALAKLDFLNTLHSQDDLLNTAQSQLKAIVLNLLAALFTGPLGFVANKIINGHYFFTQATTSQQNVAAIEHSVGVRSR